MNLSWASFRIPLLLEGFSVDWQRERLEERGWRHLPHVVRVCKSTQFSPHVYQLGNETCRERGRILQVGVWVCAKGSPQNRWNVRCLGESWGLRGSLQVSDTDASVNETNRNIDR